MPQSHLTTGPVRFLAPVRCLARKAECSARRNFTLVLFSWSHQATGPVRFHTAVHIWCDRTNRRTPHGPRAMLLRASHGPRTGISNLFHNLQGPYGARAWPARVPYDTFTYIYGKWHNQNLQKFNKGLACGRTGPYGPLVVTHGLFTGCLWYLNPYGARKLIMHALKLYGLRTERQNSYGAVQGAYGPREWTYDFCSKQHGNSTGTARTGPGSVMWLRH